MLEAVWEKAENEVRTFTKFSPTLIHFSRCAVRRALCWRATSCWQSSSQTIYNPQKERERKTEKPTLFQNGRQFAWKSWRQVYVMGISSRLTNHQNGQRLLSPAYPTLRLITSRLTMARLITSRLTTAHLKPTDFFTATTLRLRSKRIKDSIRINGRVFIRHKIPKNNKAIQHAKALIRSKETT